MHQNLFVVHIYISRPDTPSLSSHQQKNPEANELWGSASEGQLEPTAAAAANAAADRASARHPRQVRSDLVLYTFMRGDQYSNTGSERKRRFNT